MNDTINKLIITDIHKHTPDAKTFYLKNADNSPIEYLPGEHITMIFENGSDQQRRSYSFSTTPLVNQDVGITVKRISNGFASRLLIDNTKVGDRFNYIKPTGYFKLPTDLTKPKHLLFFAAGIGITPIISLIRAAIYSGSYEKITLVYSNSNISTAIFYDEINRIAVDNPDVFNVIHLLSTNKFLHEARLSKETIKKIVLDRLKINPEEVLVYQCGPLSYMRMVRWGLEEINVAGKNIKQELFYVPQTLVKPIPPDTTRQQVHIKINGKTYTYTCNYPDTILAAAKKSGVPLPYSCESGFCGTCAAKCTSGNVWHSNNEVLTEDELEDGIILTCTGHPIYRSIELSFD